MQEGGTKSPQNNEEPGQHLGAQPKWQPLQTVGGQESLGDVSLRASDATLGQTGWVGRVILADDMAHWDYINDVNTEY